MKDQLQNRYKNAPEIAEEIWIIIIWGTGDLNFSVHAKCIIYEK